MATRMTTSILSDEARDAIRHGDRIIVTEGGADLLGIVPIEDVRFLEALEDAQDIVAARAALEEDESSGGAGRIDLAAAYAQLDELEVGPQRSS